MRAIKLQTHIERDHTLRIELPPDLAEGPTEIIVLVPDRTDAGEEILPLDETLEVSSPDAIAAEIDELYREIGTLIGKRAGGPDLKEAVRPLWQRLRKLQEREADAMELRFRGRILFDPRKGRELLDQAQRTLDKK